MPFNGLLFGFSGVVSISSNLLANTLDFSNKEYADLLLDLDLDSLYLFLSSLYFSSLRSLLLY